METLNKYYKTALTIYKEELTADQYKSAYNEVKSAENEIKAELKTKTVKILKAILSQLGSWTRGDEKKDDLINNIFDCLTDYFLIGRPVSYFLGEGNHKSVKENLILNTTQEDLIKFYTERKRKQEEKEKVLNNPETLAEFREFVRIKGKESLTPEQLIKYEELTADFTLSRQQKEQEQKNIITKIEVENVDFEIYPTKHSKTKEDIFTVLMLNRVSAEDFKTLSTKAKKLGGYYSRYTDKFANPPIKAGFNFKTKDGAIAFIGLKEQDQNATPQAEEKAEEVKQSASARMKERAEAIINKAEEDLNRERKTNTNRQARQASHSEDKARAEIVFAKKLILIAEGLENDNIKYLHAIRNGKQLEQLENILNRGFYLRTKNLSYTERQKEEKNPLIDVNFIEYPFPTYGENVLNDILKNYADKSGMIKDIKNIFDYCRRNKNANGLVIIKDLQMINLLKSTALKIRDEWDKNRILESIQNFERIQKIGLTNEAILKTALRELASLTNSAKITPEQQKEIELKELERSFINKKIDGFFPTPPALIETMFGMVRIFENEKVLEPSAGLGHIAEAIKNKYPDNDLEVIEYNSALSDVLEKKGFNVQNTDFLQTSKKYDVIFMNPPFEKGQDMDHVNHAFKLLNPAGRLVAIMCANKFKTDKKTTEFNEFVLKNGYSVANPEGSFKSAFNSTGVNTITVYLEKEATPIEREEKDQKINQTVTEEETAQETQAENTQPAEIQCDNKSGEQLTFFL
jgi:phospholipid N-methyltransferase